MNPALRRSAAHVFVESLQAPVLDSADEHHLTTVLRLRAGEAVSVGDGCGSWRLCRFTAAGSLEPDGEMHTEAAPSPQLSIGFAIPKGDRPEWIVQKLTEIGIDRIVVLHADRSVVRWDAERAPKHLAKLARVAREAAMQSRRVWLPVIDGPRSVAELVRPHDGSGGAAVALAEPGGTDVARTDTTVLIGPEGGWSDAELNAAPCHVALGETILRVETAALVAATRVVDMRRS